MPLISKASDLSARARRKNSLASALRQLENGTDFGRRQAALDLMGQLEAVPALVGRLARETEPSVRSAILDAMVSVGDAEVVETLVGMLRSDEASIRNEAVSALQQLSGPVAERMEAMLADEDPDIRIMSVDVIRLLPHPEAPNWLDTLLARETHPNVVGAVIDRLAEIGTDRHLPALYAARARFEGEPYLRFAAEFVIDRIEAMSEHPPE